MMMVGDSNDVYLSKGSMLNRILLISVILLALGSYLGNWALTSGEILLCFSAVVILMSKRRPNADGVVSRSVRLSTVFLGLFLLVMLVSILIHRENYENFAKDLKKLRHLLVPLVCLVPLWMRTHLRGNWESFLKWGTVFWVFAIGLSSLVGLSGHFFGFNPFRSFEIQEYSRVSGVYGMPMTFAYSMQFSFLLLAAIFLNFDSFRRIFPPAWAGTVKWGMLLIAGVSGAALYFSYTRGAVLGVMSGLLVILLVKRSWRFLSVVGLLALAGIVQGTLTDARYFTSQASSNNQRVSQWRASFLVFLDNPVKGIGYRQFERQGGELKAKMGLPKDHVLEEDGKSVPVYFKSHSHNNYLESLVSAGVLGGLFFLGFCWSWVVEMYKASIGKSVFLPVVVAFMVTGFFESFFFDSEVVGFLMVIYVFSQIALDREEENVRATN